MLLSPRENKDFILSVVYALGVQNVCLSKHFCITSRLGLYCLLTGGNITIALIIDLAFTYSVVKLFLRASLQPYLMSYIGQNNEV